VEEHNNRRRGRGLRAFSAVLAVCCLVLCTTSAPGADKLWLTDNGDFLGTDNWSPAGAPIAGDNAIISEGRTSNLAPTTPTAIEFHEFYVGGTFDHEATFGVTNPGGTFNQSGGAIHLSGAQSWMVVADKPGNAGTYNLSGNGSIVIDDDFMTIGQHGTGFLNVSGTASIDTKGLILGRWGDPGTGTGTLKDTGSITTHANGFTLGQQGIGTFTQSGGTVTVGAGSTGYGSWAFIGGHDESTGPRTGTYNMTGGTFKSQERMEIAQGAGSTGTFNQSAGDVTIGTTPATDGFLEIGQGGVGTYNLSGGTLTVVRSLVVGAWQGGDGRFVITGGTVNIGEALQVARGSTDPGNRADPVAGLVDQKSGIVNAGWAEIGSARFPRQTFVGTYKLSGDGVLNTQFELNIGRNNSEGVFDISGGTVNVGLGGGQKTFNVGRGGKGTFTMSGGTINVPEGFNLSSFENNIVGAGTGTQTGGTINTTWVSIGQHGPSTYTMSGGTINATGDFNVGDAYNVGDPGTSAIFNLSGNAVVTANHVFVGKGGTTSGIVNQTGGTLKVGSQGLSIADQANSTGVYNLQGGILDGVVDNTMKFGGGTGTFNMTGGTLKNFKAVNFTLDNKGGRVIVGDVGVVANMAVTGNYSQVSPGALQIDIKGAGQTDVLNVSGNAKIAGNLTIDKDPAYNPVPGQTFDILTATTLTGHFDTMTGNQANSKFRFAPRYLPTGVELVVALAGDANLDQLVNMVDFQRLELNFGQTGKTWSEGDFNGDGVVDTADFKLLNDNVFQSFASLPVADRATLDNFAATHVPEPGLLGAVTLAAVSLLARRYRSR
jgi:T5SS/PEP-CTERM-associated repeat protein